MKDRVRDWSWYHNWDLGHHNIWVLIPILLPMTLGPALIFVSVK